MLKYILITTYKNIYSFSMSEHVVLSDEFNEYSKYIKRKFNL